MLTEKKFRINRFPNTSTMADDVCLICAKSNGATKNKVTLDDIESYIACEVLKYPFANMHLFVTRVDEHHLIIEKGSIRDGSEPLLEIVEYEMIDTPVVDDEANMN
jgi:hypothetical protein